jgi:hypothetical protein
MMAQQQQQVSKQIAAANSRNQLAPHQCNGAPSSVLHSLIHGKKS